MKGSRGDDRTTKSSFNHKNHAVVPLPNAIHDKDVLGQDGWALASAIHIASLAEGRRKSQRAVGNSALGERIG